MINEKDMKGLANDISMILENVACLGRDAHGEYISRCTALLINKVKQAILAEKIKDDGESDDPGTPLDTIIEKGIPKEQVNVFMGKSKLPSMMEDYIKSLKYNGDMKNLKKVVEQETAWLEHIVNHVEYFSSLFETKYKLGNGEFDYVGIKLKKELTSVINRLNKANEN